MILFKLVVVSFLDIYNEGKGLRNAFSKKLGHIKQ